MKKFAILGLALVSVLSLPGCAVAVHSEPLPFPPVVVEGPDVVVLDYWFDGVNYYYYDGGLGLYFYYDAFGGRVYCGRGWLPRGDWHRHDGGWRRDGGWGRGHEGGRFPGDGRGHFPGGDHGGHFPDGGHGGHGGRH